MSERDPLVDVLRREDGYGTAPFEHLARVAREHIAKEIEASIDAREPQNNAARWIRDGKRIAAGIARRENG